MNTIIFFLSKYGLFGVLVAAFFEAIIFPPPVEIILIPVMLANREKAILYAFITVLVSLLGAAVGYNLGKMAGTPLLIRFFKENKVESVRKVYDRYGALAIITSAFTPIPYEVYTLSAGVFKMNLARFLAAAFIGRLIRYVPEGIIIQLLGYTINNKTITKISMFVGIIIIGVLVYIIFKRFVTKWNKPN